MTNIDLFDDEMNFLSTKDYPNKTYFLENSFDHEDNGENEEIDIHSNFNNTDINNLFYDKVKSENFESLSFFEAEDNLNVDNKIIRNFLYVPKKEPKTKTKLGRKTKNSDEKGNHTRDKEDNMIRKSKVIFKDSFLDFINSKLEETFPKNFKITIDGKEYKVKLLKIIQNKVKDTNVEFNKKLLNDTIKDFFSDKIGGNFTNYPKNFNELLFKKLSEMDNGKKIISMVNMTFLEWLKYFRMDEDIFKDPEYSSLNGLEKDFLGLREKLSEKYNENYIHNLIHLIKNFEIIYENKRGRELRKPKSNTFK